MRNLHNETEDSMIELLPQVMGFTNPSSVSFTLKSLQRLQRILVLNNYSDVYSAVKEVTRSCEELLLKCKWINSIVDCKTLFFESYTTDGICCSFNYFRFDISLRA